MNLFSNSKIVNNPIENIIETFTQNGQGHLFNDFSSLKPEQQTHLIKQLHSIDLSLLGKLKNKLSAPQPAESINANKIRPSPYISFEELTSRSEQNLLIKDKGLGFLKSGKLAILTVAGGCGTRLGANCPKGTLPATPIKQKSLFQVFAEKIKSASQHYNVSIPWFIMTSPANHHQTIDFFKLHNHFDLPSIHFFQQNQLPVFDFHGKIIRSSADSIAFSPDGHGGIFDALQNTGMLTIMHDLGIEIISYHQVDNALAHIIDPLFIGYHLKDNSDISSKMVIKKTAEEKVGLFCSTNDHLCIIEYSNLPEDLQNKKDTHGDFYLKNANIALHLINRTFIDTLTSSNASIELPYHSVIKATPFYEDGCIHTPAKPNTVRFERFIFDALPYANKPILVETNRALEFSPIKNAHGTDSIETASQDQLKLHRSWLQAALKANNDPRITTTNWEALQIEISPLAATSQEDFITYWHALEKAPKELSSLYFV